MSIKHFELTCVGLGIAFTEKTLYFASCWDDDYKSAIERLTTFPFSQVTHIRISEDTGNIIFAVDGQRFCLAEVPDHNPPSTLTPDCKPTYAERPTVKSAASVDAILALLEVPNS